MDFLIQVFAWFLMIGIISILVIVHECGHFLVARFFGFQTPIFGIGLPVGPYIVLGHKWGTQFRIHACLLGGFVAIPELGDESQHDKEAYGDLDIKPFKKFPIWQRALVAVAGVSFNVLFAYLIMLCMLLSQGLPVTKVTVEGLPKENPIAATAGVQVKDVIKSIDSAPVKSEGDAIAYLTAHPLTPVTLHLLRGDKPVDIVVTPNASGKVGMGLAKTVDHYESLAGKNIIEIAGLGVTQLYDLTAAMMQALGMMFSGIWNNLTSFGKPVATGSPNVSIGDMHGILAVLKIGADIAKDQDWSQLFLFTILISMDLAIINLVPWPALDGGHLAFMCIEGLRGKPMGERTQGEIVKWGMLSLLALMAIIMVNDVMALVTGKLEMKKKEEQPVKPGSNQSTTVSPTTAPSATEAPATPGTAPAAPGTEPGTAPGASTDGTASPATPGTAPTGAAPGTAGTAPTTPGTAPAGSTPAPTGSAPTAPPAPSAAAPASTEVPATAPSKLPAAAPANTPPASSVPKSDRAPEEDLADHLTKTAPAK